MGASTAPRGGQRRFGPNHGSIRSWSSSATRSPKTYDSTKAPGKSPSRMRRTSCARERSPSSCQSLSARWSPFAIRRCSDATYASQQPPVQRTVRVRNSRLFVTFSFQLFGASRASSRTGHCGWAGWWRTTPAGTRHTIPSNTKGTRRFSASPRTRIAVVSSPAGSGTQARLAEPRLDLPRKVGRGDTARLRHGGLAYDVDGSRRTDNGTVTRPL
jgi:hypothetical protein